MFSAGPSIGAPEDALYQGSGEPSEPEIIVLVRGGASKCSYAPPLPPARVGPRVSRPQVFCTGSGASTSRPNRPEGFVTNGRRVQIGR